MRLGMIGRCDQGGLGTLLWEFARHMNPHRVLLMDLGPAGRGLSRPQRYAGLDVRTVTGVIPTPADVDWLLKGSDVVYSAETFYHPHLVRRAREWRTRTVLHSMPELHRPDYEADEVWIPTSYLADRYPSTRLVPVPVALDRFEARVRSPVEHIVHLGAPAMLDRNGTEAFLAALALVRSPVRATIIGPRPLYGPSLPADSPVQLDWVDGEAENYYERLPADTDLLVMPRRFAGLSLPVQEAAAAGIPTIMTAVPPQKDQWPIYGVRASLWREEPMAGGLIPVWSPDVAHLASAIDYAVTHPTVAERMSSAALAWAQARSWDRMRHTYRRLLGL